MKNIIKHIKLEKGLFLGLATIFMRAILSALLILGLDTYLIKNASANLRKTNDAICQNLAEGTLAIQSDLFIKYKNIIESLPRLYPIGKVTVEKAKLIIPTMPILNSSFDLFNPDYDYSYLRIVQDGENTFINDNIDGINFGELGESYKCENSNLSSNFECFIQVHLLQNLENKSYPRYLWNNFDNAGNAIGCELEAYVKTIGFNIPGIEFFNNKIIARSVAWKRIRGEYTKFDFTDEDAPGLTIAISTHLQTNTNNHKFIFPNPTPNFEWWNDHKDIYNPLRVLDFDPNDNLNTSFIATANQHLYNGSTFLGSLEVSDQNNKKERILACTNPLILARNIFLTTIVELASRNGHSRSTTEILNIGTKNRNVSDTGELPTQDSLPSVIVPYGQDLTNKSYELPFVYFNTGDSATPNQFQGPTPSGNLNPFSRQDHATISRQLRDCYHLYINYSQQSTKIQKYDLTNTINNSFFEDNLIGGAYYNSNIFMNNQTYTNWDQACPWTNTPPIFCSGSKLKATDVVASLGSTQSCPYKFIQNNGIDCEKPYIDLEPDLISLLKYLGNEIQAISSPGLFPDGEWQYTANQNIYTPLILVTHQAISDNEVIAIQNILASDTWENRPITVVYFPSINLNVDDVVENFNEAFNIGVGPKDNHLFIFSPYTENNYDIYKHLNNEDIFLYYWMDLINPDSPEYIAKKAINVFNSQMVTEWKF